MKTLKNKLKAKYYAAGASMTMGTLALSTPGHAAAPNFSSISSSITDSMSGLPGLISGVSYLMGLLLAALGIMKIKDHVEQPTSIPLKDGAIRLAGGGALLTTGYVATTMLNTIGTGNVVDQQGLRQVGDGFFQG